MGFPENAKDEFYQSVTRIAVQTIGQRRLLIGMSR
jgi:hypothetical protein